MALMPCMNPLAPYRRPLLALARRSIEQTLHAADQAQCRSPPGELRGNWPVALNESRASFVTLYAGDQLRGCCGTLVATRPIGEDVWRNAWASAFADPRFPPLMSDEWSGLQVHISVLSPLERIDVDSEQMLLATLRPHVDGLVLDYGGSRATFLPAVWEQITDPTRFVMCLKQKAGWHANFWSTQVKVWRYTTDSFGDHDVVGHSEGGDE